MTKFDKIGSIVCLALVIVGFALAASVVKTCKTDHSGSVWVRQTYLDSLAAIANLPPDTVTIIKVVKGPPVYVDKPYPVPVYTDKDSVKHYSDSLSTCDIDAKVDLKVKGDLLDLNWTYRPITEQINTTITKPEPYPVKYEVKIPTPQAGLFMMIGLGKGWKLPTPILSGQLFFMTKTSRIVGIESGYFQAWYYKVNFGIKF